MSQEGVWFEGSSFSAFSLSSTATAAFPLCGGSLGHLADAVSGVYDCAAQNGDMAAANGEGTRDDIPEINHPQNELTQVEQNKICSYDVRFHFHSQALQGAVVRCLSTGHSFWIRTRN